MLEISTDELLLDNYHGKRIVLLPSKRDLCILQGIDADRRTRP